MPHHVVSVCLGHEAGPAFAARWATPHGWRSARMTVRTPASHRQVPERIASRARARTQPVPPRRRTGRGRGLRPADAPEETGPDEPGLDRQPELAPADADADADAAT